VAKIVLLCPIIRIVVLRLEPRPLLPSLSSRELVRLSRRSEELVSQPDLSVESPPGPRRFS
jgi:hypothetical protein